MKKVDSNKKKKVLVLLSVFVLVFALAGTFAWTSYTDWVRNHLQSLGFNDGKVTIIEEFNPEDKPVLPGTEIQKTVNVINTSPVASFVRVSFEEELQKLGENATGAKESPDDLFSADEEAFPIVIDTKSYVLEGKDQTAKLRIDQQLVGADSPFKLVLTGKGDSQASIFKVITLSKANFPDHYDFDSKVGKLPFYTPNATTANYDSLQEKALDELKNGEEVEVAQKLSANIVRNTAADTYDVVTKDQNEEKNLKFWTFSDKIQALEQADWAGKNVWVGTESAPIDTLKSDVIGKMLVTDKSGKAYLKSGLDENLHLNVNKETILVGAGSTYDFNKVAKNNWFLNTEDGYLYYLEALQPGTTTSMPVITSIKFPDNDTYFLSSYELHVGSEAVPAMRSMLQAASNGGDIANKADYDTKGKATEANGYGFGLKTNSKLYDHLANQSTLEDAE